MTRFRAFILPILILGLIGFADATFLTIKKLSNGTVPCVITQGCDLVTNSSYANIGVIPLSALGMAFYLCVILLSIKLLESQQRAWLRPLVWITGFGFLFSLYLLFVQAFLIQAYCFYCLISAGTSIALFITSLLGLKRISHVSGTPPISRA